MRSLPDSFNKMFNKPVKKILLDKEGEEIEFEFLPLNAEQFAAYSDLSRRSYELLEATKKTLGKDKLSDEEAGMVIMNKEHLSGMFELLTDIVMTSYPELKEDIASQFVVDNFDQLMGIIEDLSPIAEKSSRTGAIEKIKNLQNFPASPNTPKTE
jgi:hypothetical protein